MTDDSRFRAPRAHGTPQAQPAGSRVRRTEDPLAELARLIGQEDPFADFVTHRPADNRAGGHAGVPRRPVNPRDARAHDSRAVDRRRPAPSAARTADPLADDFGFPDEPQVEGRSSYSYGGRAPRAPELPATPALGLRDERPGASRSPARPAEQQAPVYDDAEEIDLEQPRSPRDTRSARRAVPTDDDEYGEYAAEDYDPEYDDEAYLPAHGDEFYDEAPRRRLKGWLIVGAAAVGAIIVGTSGLFAYRALFGPEIAAVPARVISPDSAPTKMVPGGTAQAEQKRIQDRVGEPSRSAERIVPREESPIDQSRIPQSGTADRVAEENANRIPGGNVTAAAPQFSPAPTAAPAQNSTPPAMTAPPNFSTEPRRVRTVTVRADGTIVSDPARSATASNTARPAPAATTATPLALQGGQPALPPPRPAGTTNSAPLQGDNPWSNSPSSGQVGTQASLPPPPPAPAPAIAVNTPPPAGSYVVQVAAQRSESEAQATWQVLQQRYPSILGAQQASIRRYDLGQRGVFYRAQVGPFSNRAQASEICQSLKAAGGDCVIQRN